MTGPDRMVWRSADGTRFFGLGPGDRLPTGAFEISRPDGTKRSVTADIVSRFEISEAVARDLMRDELAAALVEMKRAIDGKIDRGRAALDNLRSTSIGPTTPTTPDAVPALFALVRKLPRAVLDSLSGEPERVIRANGSLAGLRERLNAAGVDIDRRLPDFAYRLAALRRDFELARGGAGGPEDRP